MSDISIDAQLLRLAVQQLACAPQAQRRMVQLGLEAGPVIFEEAIEPTDDATPKK